MELPGSNQSAFPTDLPSIDKLPTHARMITDSLRKLGYTSEKIAAALGADGLACISRHEPAGLIAACRRARTEMKKSEAHTNHTVDAIEFFIARLPLERAAFTEKFGEEFAAALEEAGVVVGNKEGKSLRAAIDIRPLTISYPDHSSLDFYIFSDADSSMDTHIPGRDHVLGAGAASLSLLNATPQTPTGTVLDLGTGCGIQALGQILAATKIYATDIHPRAITFAEATFTSARHLLAEGETPAGAELETKIGSWFEPVDGMTFDRIVANPPFVVGPATTRHIYRDSGLELDGATRHVIESIPPLMAEGGDATILGSWLHTDEMDWTARIASWLPSHGIRAWVMERDRVDPYHYVGTWVKDESLDPRSPEGIETSGEWIDYFEQSKVSAIGFGYIALQEIGSDRTTELVCEDFSGLSTDNLAEEITEYFLRCEWLDSHNASEILESRFLVRPGLAVEEISVADSEAQQGFSLEVVRVTRTEGPGYSHDIDRRLLQVFRGLHPQGLSFADTCEIAEMALGNSFDFPSDDDAPGLAEQCLPALIDSIRHGLVIPADLVLSLG